MNIKKIKAAKNRLFEELEAETVESQTDGFDNSEPEREGQVEPVETDEDVLDEVDETDVETLEEDILFKTMLFKLYEDIESFESQTNDFDNSDPEREGVAEPVETDEEDIDNINNIDVKELEESVITGVAAAIGTLLAGKAFKGIKNLRKKIFGPSVKDEEKSRKNAAKAAKKAAKAEKKASKKGLKYEIEQAKVKNESINDYFKYLLEEIDEDDIENTKLVIDELEKTKDEYIEPNEISEEDIEDAYTTIYESIETLLLIESSMKRKTKKNKLLLENDYFSADEIKKRINQRRDSRLKQSTFPGETKNHNFNKSEQSVLDKREELKTIAANILKDKNKNVKKLQKEHDDILKEAINNTLTRRLKLEDFKKILTLKEAIEAAETEKIESQTDEFDNSDPEREGVVEPVELEVGEILDSTDLDEVDVEELKEQFSLIERYSNMKGVSFNATRLYENAIISILTDEDDTTGELEDGEMVQDVSKEIKTAFGDEVGVENIEDEKLNDETADQKINESFSRIFKYLKEDVEIDDMLPNIESDETEKTDEGEIKITVDEKGDVVIETGDDEIIDDLKIQSISEAYSNPEYYKKDSVKLVPCVDKMRKLIDSIAIMDAKINKDYLYNELIKVTNELNDIKDEIFEKYGEDAAEKAEKISKLKIDGKE